MEYARKGQVSKVVEPARPILKPNKAPDPESESQLRLAKLEWDMQRGTSIPVAAQRQAAQPIFRATELHAQEMQWVEGPRVGLQRQAAELTESLPEHAVETALQRQAERHAPVVAPTRPQSPGDWVTVMRAHAQKIQAQQDAGQGMYPKQWEEHKSLQRQVTQSLVQGFRQDRQAPEARYAEYAEHLVSLQRQELSTPVARAFLGFMPQGERMALQRAVDTALQREREQQEQDEQALSLHAIQRRLAELDAQATQPVFERIQARRGAGNPLPETVQRHLEQGLNADLSRVRIHDDAEADKLAKGVNAIAFTTGSDIFFQSGKYEPNTQSGLELLAHEATHAKQQATGQVGPGIDPSPALEAEAQASGRQIAQVMPSAKSLMPPSPHAPGVYSHAGALQRAQDGAASTFALKPLYDLQPPSIQRSGWRERLSGAWDATGGRVVGAITDQAKAAVSSTLAAIPGYRELSLALGKDLVTGRTMEGNPNAILDALAGFVPGPLKDILKALKETGAIPKAWAWFKAELGKLNLGGALSEVTAAIGKADLGAAKNAITSRVGGLKSLIVGSARKIAEIGLTALAAGLGPIGQQVIAKLRSSGDLIIQVLKNPAKFAGNLLNALKGGFSGFARNAPKHLQNGLGQWLTGASGITFPAKLDLAGVFMTALSVMGLTYQVLRGKLVRQLGGGGEQKVQQAEKTVGALQTLKSGIHKADEMKASQGSVGGEVTSGLKSEVTKSVVLAGITKVATMLIPGGGFINALIGAFRSVQFLIEQGKQIMGVVTSAISSVGAIAAGNIGAAVGHVESTLARSIPVALGFLGKLIGIGNIGGKIKAVIQKVRGRLDGVVDKVLARIRKVIEKFTGKGKPGTKPAQDAKSPAKANLDGTYGKVSFQAGKEAHSVWTVVKNAQPEIYIASTPAKAITQLSNFKKEAVALNIYNDIRVHFADAGQAVSTGIAIMRKSLTSTDRDVRLMIDRQATEASNRIARYVGVIRRTTQEARNRPTKMPPIDVQFDASEYPKDVREYRLQLFEQQTGINRKTVAQWMTQRSAFLASGRGSASAQRAARRSRRALLISIFETRILKHDPNATPATARAEASQLADQWLSTQAALHAPDQIAGSQATDIAALGRREINGSIGGSWPSRIGTIDAGVSSYVSSNPTVDRNAVKMNVSLHL